ncbi:pilus assembly protein N-terminal domain-containing protein [Pseudochrobactrum kiredjianiae]|uniref:pilus assembly protein N-terminal domain-containing protein n=1 Tax=Pseudochrobactrum kiredjianiae TaxID=386305 RepID=UPI0025A15EDB|nr:pilus assembly protein N-terminal domain-containing protein [Pseudochrobactrum kiredjianiae]MDM7849682.1 pilus assembly protein N-terminal domain-containing protein [Pseudochrobactrum kiredjianiae]
MAYKNMINLKKLIFLSLLSAGLLTHQARAEEIQTIQIKTDQAHILRLDKPVKSIIIGNDAIVDAMMQDAKTIVLTGRNNGVTNLVVMDQNGVTMLDEQVMVGQNDLATTRVFRGSDISVLSCTPICEPKAVSPKL